MYEYATSGVRGEEWSSPALITGSYTTALNLEGSPKPSKLADSA